MKFAPAKEICHFWCPKHSPASIFSKKIEFSKIRCHDTICLVTYNCLNSQPRRIRSRQDHAITNWNWSILALFEIKHFQESKTPENTENVPSAHGRSIRQLTLARYFSTVQPLYEPFEIWTAAPLGNEIRASEENSWISVPKPFTSFNIFEIFEFSKFRRRDTPCLVSYNFLISQRQAVGSR